MDKEKTRLLLEIWMLVVVIIVFSVYLGNILDYNKLAIEYNNLADDCWCVVDNYEQEIELQEPEVNEEWINSKEELS